MSKMNSQKVLALLSEMGTLEEIREVGGWAMVNAWRQLHEYATECLHFEIANKNGGRKEETRRSTALKFLKNTEIKPVSGKHWMGNSWIADGYQYFSDGCIVFRFADGHHIEGLPQIVPGKDCSVPKNIGVVLNQLYEATYEAPVTKIDLETAIATWKAEGKKYKYPEIKIGIAFYNAELLLNALKIIGVDKTTIKQKRWDSSGHIDIDGRTAAFMPLDPPEGDMVFKMLDNGAFVCGDKKFRVTAYAYPGSLSAQEAMETPEFVAERLLRESKRHRDTLEPNAGDEAHWKLLEAEDTQQANELKYAS